MARMHSFLNRESGGKGRRVARYVRSERVKQDPRSDHDSRSPANRIWKVMPVLQALAFGWFTVNVHICWAGGDAPREVGALSDSATCLWSPPPVVTLNANLAQNPNNRAGNHSQALFLRGTLLRSFSAVSLEQKWLAVLWRCVFKYVVVLSIK